MKVDGPGGHGGKHIETLIINFAQSTVQIGKYPWISFRWLVAHAGCKAESQCQCLMYDVLES